MSAFPRVRLHSSKPTRTVVPKLLNVFVVPNRPVVRCKNHKCVIRHAGGFQSLQHSSNMVINHHHKIAVHSRLAFASELSGRQPGCVGGRVCQIHHQRGLRFGRRVLLENADRFFGKSRQHVLQSQVRSDPSFSPEFALNRRPSCTGICTNVTGGRTDGSITSDVKIGRNICRRSDAKKRIEASICRSAR